MVVSGVICSCDELLIRSEWYRSLQGCVANRCSPVYELPGSRGGRGEVVRCESRSRTSSHRILCVAALKTTKRSSVLGLSSCISNLFIPQLVPLHISHHVGEARRHPRSRRHWHRHLRCVDRTAFAGYIDDSILTD